MKKIVILVIAVLIYSSIKTYAQESAADSKLEEVKIKASITCNYCKEKIEKNIAFEKGVKDLSVDMETKVVTIKYNKEKTNPEKLVAAIKKLDLDAEVVKSCCSKDDANVHKCNEVKDCSKKSDVHKNCSKASEVK